LRTESSDSMQLWDSDYTGILDGKNKLLPLNSRFVGVYKKGRFLVSN